MVVYLVRLLWFSLLSNSHHQSRFYWAFKEHSVMQIILLHSLPSDKERALTLLEFKRSSYCSHYLQTMAWIFDVCEMHALDFCELTERLDSAATAIGPCNYVTVIRSVILNDLANRVTGLLWTTWPYSQQTDMRWSFMAFPIPQKHSRTSNRWKLSQCERSICIRNRINLAVMHSAVIQGYILFSRGEGQKIS